MPNPEDDPSRPGPATASPASPLLEVTDLFAAYGPYQALFGVTFSVPERSVVALVGPNGAGKSTVARVVSGLVKPTSGTIVFDGRDITRWPPWRIARLGLSHVPEGRSVLSSLTVEENLILAFRQALGRHYARDALERAYELFPRLRERPHQLAGTLSGGEQRMLGLAKVLALSARLLIVDEVSLGLDRVVLDEVFRALRTARTRGTSLLVVEQHIGLALDLADSVVLLSQGQVIRQGSVDDLGDVVSSLLPSDVSDLAASGDLEPTGGEPHGRGEDQASGSNHRSDPEVPRKE